MLKKSFDKLLAVLDEDFSAVMRRHSHAEEKLAYALR
jgi:hypothetical protein